MKKVIIFLCLLCCNIAAAQDALWITGSAVPGGTQQLTKATAENLKFAGQLNAGELRIMTTKKAGPKTVYLAPTVADACVANNGLSYRQTTRADEAVWQVPVADPFYRFSVNTATKTLKGEIFQPWGELFIAGGATEVGWKCEGKMLLMKHDVENPCVWTWEGELKKHPEVEEPTSFKFQGQDRWRPKSLHPYIQGTDILTNQQLRTGGADTKWQVKQEGRYRITVNVFYETVQALFLGK